MKIHIRKVRTEKGMSIRELSAASDIALSHIYNIENERKIPSLTVLCKIADALDVHAAELFSCDK